MPSYSPGPNAWSTPSAIHDNLVPTFDIDTSPSLYSRVKDPIIRINRSPAPLEQNYPAHHSKHALPPMTSHRSKMPVYNDPAFSMDPRVNPHFVHQDAQWFSPPPYSESVEPDPGHIVEVAPSRRSKSKSTPLRTPSTVTLPSASNERLNTDAAVSAQSQRSTPPEVTPTHDARSSRLQPPEEARPRQKSAHRSHSRDLDQIDVLDETDPFGTRYHHRGPYQSANEAFVARKTSVNRNDPVTNHASKQSRSLHRAPHQPPMPIGASINLAPGQIFPRMPYQPQPPADYISPAPTSAPLFPDPYPYDVHSPPHAPAQYQYMNMPEPVIPVMTPVPQFMQSPPFPLPPPNAYSDSHNLSYMPLPQQQQRQQRHSYAAPPPPNLPPSHYQAPTPPGVRRTPSFPSKVLPRENIPAFSQPSHNQVSPQPSIHRSPSFPTELFSRANAPTTLQELPPSPDISLPPQPVRAAPPTKPAPRHLPKRLVMPTPLQPQQQVTPHSTGNHSMNESYGRDEFSARHGQGQGASNGHGTQQPMLMPRAQEIPMIPDEKDARHLLRKKTTVGANGVVDLHANGRQKEKPVKEKPVKEKPVKEKSGGLFRGGDSLGSKLGRKLSKMR